jgi:rhomboid family GlyGly-CTERM serine protease
MDAKRSSPWWSACPWTLAMAALLAAANLPAWFGSGSVGGAWLEALQFDRQAILHGELWRVATGSFVHWSVEHFLLDVSVFVLLGFLYERQVPRYPWLILACTLAVGIGVFALMPELAIYRGMSGVDSGQFAAALCVEAHLARRDRRRWLWLGPVTCIFAAKLVWELASGQLFFGTESLGNIGLPVPAAHAAGAAAALALAGGLPRIEKWLRCDALCSTEQSAA